jgi:hypothetical protein
MRYMHSPIHVREATHLFDTLCCWEYNICNFTGFAHKSALTYNEDICLCQERSNTGKIGLAYEEICPGYPKHHNGAFVDEIKHALNVCVPFPRLGLAQS